MPKYRLYYLNMGKIEGADTLEAKHDDIAMVLVRARKLPLTCEIWDGDRLVGRVPLHLHSVQAAPAARASVLASACWVVSQFEFTAC
jgi:hypothetical protein